MSRKALRAGAQGIANNLGSSGANNKNDRLNALLEKRIDKQASSSPSLSSSSSPPPVKKFSLWNIFSKPKPQPEVPQPQTTLNSTQPQKKIERNNEKEKRQVEFYSWGEGAGAQLGHGDDKSRKIPSKISSLSGKGLFSSLNNNNNNNNNNNSNINNSNNLLSTMSCGLMHAGIITERGETFTWGHNMFMQVGHDHSGGGLLVFVNEREPFPSSLRSLLPSNLSFLSLSLGTWHSLALGDENTNNNKIRKVYVWGNGYHGQLGVETEQSFKQKKMLGSNYQFPTELKSLSRPLSHPSHVIMVSAGSTHSAALTNDGKVYMWGGKRIPSPIEIDVRGKKIKKIASGALHTIVLTEEGEIYSWGSGRVKEQPIHEGMDPYFFPGTASVIPSSPNEITKVEIENVAEIAAGNDLSAALTKSGEMYLWRGNEKPEIVPELNGKKIVEIAVSWTHVAAVTEHGGLYMWRYSGESIKPETATKPSLQMKKEDTKEKEEDKFSHIAMHLTSDPCGNAVRPTRVRSGALKDLFVLSVRLGWNFALAATLPRSSSSLIWSTRNNNNASNNTSENRKDQLSSNASGGRLKRGTQYTSK